MPKIGEPMTAEATAAKDTAVEADMDAALAKVTGKPVDTPAPAQAAPVEPTDGQGRDNAGKFAKAVATDSTTEPQPSETPEPAKADGVNSEGYDKALKALQFDNVPVKVLAGMSNDEIIEWGNSRAKNHGDWQTLREEVAALRKAAPGESVAVKDPIKANDAYETELADLAEVFGDDAVEPFRKVLEAASTAATGQTQALFDRLTKMEQSAARRELDGEWNLSEDSRWKQVLEVRNADRNEYESETDALRAAARQAFADETLADYKRKLAHEHKQRSNGQPMTESAATAPSARDGTTVAQLEDQLLNAIKEQNEPEKLRIAGLLGRGSAERSLQMMTLEGQVGMSR